MLFQGKERMLAATDFEQRLAIGFDQQSGGRHDRAPVVSRHGRLTEELMASAAFFDSGRFRGTSFRWIGGLRAARIAASKRRWAPSGLYESSSVCIGGPAVVAWPGLSEHESKIIGNLWEESDRAAAIIAATVLEERLERKIRSRLRLSHTVGDLTERLLKDVFRPSGPLGSFSIKIDFGYLTEIYNGIVRSELATIKDIRNKFAHRMDVQNFKSQGISGLCDKLKLIEQFVVHVDDYDAERLVPGRWGTRLPEVYLANPKYRYIATCGIYARLLTWHVGPQMPAILGDGPLPLPAKSGQPRSRRPRPTDLGRRTPKALP
jgi:hypothetical protein